MQFKANLGFAFDTHFTNDQQGEVDAEFTASLSTLAVLTLWLDNSLCGWLSCASLAV